MISGEPRSVDNVPDEEFLPKFQEYIEIEGLTAEQILTADKTALYYKMLPDTTFAQKGDVQAKTSFKQAKHRLTILFACNWAESLKLKPLVIRKYKSPRC
jgi:5'-deoxynucleotidase YfbR-like HD superfamily hydrolase